MIDDDLRAGRPRSRKAATALAHLVPGGAHTYAKGPDQYPEELAPVIARGLGARVWDVDGVEYVEYGSGLRSVALGHGHPRVLAAVRESLDIGTNFARPSALELQAAKALLSLFPATDMVKFCKNASDATTAALRLARAVTGRDAVALCGDQPFFSTDDWFIATTPMHAGIPQVVRDLTRTFPYDDLGALETVLRDTPGGVAAVVMEAAWVREPSPGYLSGVRQLCTAHGALFVLDETITAFRWNTGGAQAEYGIDPDLAIFGKALGNGFSVSALAGRREFMQRGGLATDEDRVFLLSTTHGAESTGLAAACAVIDVYRSEPIIETLYRRGAEVAAVVEAAAAAAGVADHVRTAGRACNLVYATLDEQGRPSQAFRTLFLQELLRHGVLAPSFVVSAALDSEGVARTAEAVHAACEVYARALTDGIDRYLIGRPVQPAIRARG